MVPFPSYVANSGGFQLYKCAPNSRELELLSKLAHAPPAKLKQLVNNGVEFLTLNWIICRIQVIMVVRVAIW